MAEQRNEIGGSERLEAGFVAMDIDGKRMLAEEQGAQPFSAKGDDIVGVLLQLGELGGALLFRRRGRECGSQHGVGQSVEGTLQIGRQHFDGEAEAVVARERAERSPHLLNPAGDLGRGPPPRILGQQRRQQVGGAATTRSLVQRAAQKQEAQVKIGEPGIPLKQEACAVGQGGLLEVREGGAIRARAATALGRRRSRIDRHRGQAPGHQVGLEHAAEVGGTGEE